MMSCRSDEGVGTLPDTARFTGPAPPHAVVPGQEVGDGANRLTMIDDD